MIVITGSAGFIGSCMVGRLNAEGYFDIVLVDDFSKSEKEKNYSSKKFTAKVERKNFINWLDGNHKLVQIVVHLGARTDTTEFDYTLLEKLNTEYSKNVWNKCIEFGLPLIYASSAATYGDGELGYSDEHSWSEKLHPLNPYGKSKNEFDKWVLKQEKSPYFWAGLKFFNVYGPNEYHKKRMASVIYHAFGQVKNNNRIRLFRSHKNEYKNGEQIRDFIYVKDVCDVIFFLMNTRKNSGIYNLGTGAARSFNDLANAVFTSLKVVPEIEYIDIPEDIRDKYQYYTQAEMKKLRNAGYIKDFTTLESGVNDYINNYLVTDSYF